MTKDKKKRSLPSDEEEEEDAIRELSDSDSSLPHEKKLSVGAKSGKSSTTKASTPPPAKPKRKYTRKSTKPPIVQSITDGIQGRVFFIPIILPDEVRK